MVYVTIRGGVAHRIYTEVDGWPESDFVATDGPVEVGWVYSDGSFVDPSSAKAGIVAINAQTSRAIDAGFVFRDRRFSLSLVSQITISNAYTIRATIPYPLRWADADDTGFVVMESAADVEAFYQAATLAVLVARSTGNAAKAAAIEG